MSKFIPKRIFIVPYRNRPEQKFFFCKYMQFLLEHMNDYEVYFSHQTDERSFNRGATRNIGFLAMKDKYPDDYQNITFIFNDLDTIPFNRIFDYDTSVGIVKHYYGYKHSLGGIVVIKGSDFEKINGYPNFWSWGLEDSCLQRRCETNHIQIDRSDFYKIGSPEILQLFDGVDRIINGKDPHKLKTDTGAVGLSTIRDLEFTIDKKSTLEIDNVYSSLGEHFYYININEFFSETRFEDDRYYKYDLREPTTNITQPSIKKLTSNVNISPNEWSQIPYYPTSEERKEIQEIIRVSPAVRMPQPIPNPAGGKHLAGARTIVNRAAPTNKGSPATFKQMKAQNAQIFPPKSTSNAGGASALNRINLRYRMTKI